MTSIIRLPYVAALLALALSLGCPAPSSQDGKDGAVSLAKLTAEPATARWAAPA